MVKSTTKEYHSPTIELSKAHLPSTESLQLMILLTKFTQSAHTSKRPTTSCGLSNLEAPEEDSVKRDIPSKEEEIGEIEKL